MQLGIIGAGRMGANLARRLQRGGHEPVVTDTSADALKPLAAEGVRTARDAMTLVSRLIAPRAVWIMVPAGYVDAVISDLAPHLETGDVIIDGGNSRWEDDIGRAARLSEQGLHYLDVGTSGGVHGLDRGYCLMIGGEAEHVDRLAPIFEALAPGVGAAARTDGRDGPVEPGENGWLHCGPSGAGHFVKMVHNGIEYGVMAAYAEGLNLLRHAAGGAVFEQHSAEVAPMRSPSSYLYDIDVAAVAEVWRRGSVIGSWLLDLTAAALAEDPNLDSFDGRVSDSGEGRWAVQAAIDLAVPVPVLSAAVYQRFSSRGEAEGAGKVLSAMRYRFGGHHERTSE